MHQTILSRKQKLLLLFYFSIILIYFYARLKPEYSNNFVTYFNNYSNLNPFAFISNEYYTYPVKILLIHLLFFIPIGIAFANVKQIDLYFIIFIVLFEGMQIIFKVGVFDINSIILYYIGFKCGKLIKTNFFNLN